ncbi:MAG: hypothetical protein BMS9Abin36_2102 [Gammaproteobacteria bacterium]|nr:MAG: hypothetical protein BMS9Abin36_2102 [Gammaproteobacteria bacterium]
MAFWPKGRLQGKACSQQFLHSLQLLQTVLVFFVILAHSCAVHGGQMQDDVHGSGTQEHESREEVRPETGREIGLGGHGEGLSSLLYRAWLAYRI